MRNATLVSSQNLRNGAALSAGWTVRGATDFNQDREMDILIQHSDGRVVVWLMSGSHHLRTVLLRKMGPSNSRIVGMK